MSNDRIGNNGFNWFIGIVEDIKDPLELGRVRVRVLGEHYEEVGGEDLPWAQVMVSATSASIGGIGVSPTGSEVGSKVVGFFIDGDSMQYPLIIGSFHTIPEMNDAKHGVSALARARPSITKEKIGPEPDSAYKSEYPYNKTMTSKSGHAIEVDDTPGHERIHIFHKSGSYYEINENGRCVRKSVEDDFEIVSDNKYLYINDGNYSVEVKDGDINIKASGDINIEADGDVNIKGSKVNLN